MKIDSFSLSSSQYRKNVSPQGTQGHGFAKKLNETATAKFSENHNTATAVNPEKKTLGNTDKFFISTHKHNTDTSKTDDSSAMIERAKKSIMSTLPLKSDPAQIQKIKEQIATGSYKIDPTEIAKKVIDFYSSGN